MNPACGPKPLLLGQFDGFVHGGVVGDAVEPENLVKAEAQQVLQRRLLRAAGGLAGDQPIQRRLPADDAIDQFLAQAAVGGRKPRSGQRVFEQVLDEIPARAPRCRTRTAISLGFSPLTTFNNAIPLGGRER